MSEHEGLSVRVIVVLHEVVVLPEDLGRLLALPASSLTGLVRKGGEVELGLLGVSLSLQLPDRDEALVQLLRTEIDFL